MKAFNAKTPTRQDAIVKNFAALLLCALALILAAFPASAEQPMTYYIDYAQGKDYPTNSGLSTNAPWQHQPYMANGTTFGYPHQPGDHFIFKGGVTWPSNCFGASGMVIPGAGSSSVYDYYGVDQTWFAGANWSRPVFDGQYVAGSIFNLSAGFSYLTIDSIEACHITRSSVHTGNSLLRHDFCQNMVFTNLYLHGWKPFAGDGLDQDQAGGGVFGNYSSGTGPTGMYLLGSDVDNAENGATGNWNGFAVTQEGCISNCTIHDNGGLITGTIEVRNSRVWDSGYPYTNIDTDFHIDTCYLSNPSGQAYGTASNCYCVGNYVWNCGGENAGLVYADCGGVDCYVYNNILFGHVNGSPIYVDTISEAFTTTPAHSFYCYNNTAISTFTNGFMLDMRVAYIDNNPSNAKIQWQNFEVTNNFFSGPGTQKITENDAPTWAIQAGTNNNLVITPAQAAFYGYILPNFYAPVSTNSPTVGAGANLSSLDLFNGDILGSARPSTGAWDIGAYEFQSGGGGGGNPPPSGAPITITLSPGAKLKINVTNNSPFTISITQ